MAEEIKGYYKAIFGLEMSVGPIIKGFDLSPISTDKCFLVGGTVLGGGGGACCDKRNGWE